MADDTEMADRIDRAADIDRADEIDWADRIDWDGLRARAKDMAARAYAPYSNFPVGAAALVDDGRVVEGCNVENAGYGMSLCAECGLVSDLVAGGGGRLVAFACVNAFGEPLMPCGRCRQLLFEHGGRELLMDTPRGVWTLDQVLPQAFGPDDLDHVAAHRDVVG
ncbi:cytidine deaminase [Aestuariimicrobium kwangyangense]|uniref:cytidine deaminase n=1 Tax=Aestuariimicrobium kwangyangense TaxID=396389 RepID=UPI0003B34FCC